MLPSDLQDVLRAAERGALDRLALLRDHAAAQEGRAALEAWVCHTGRLATAYAVQAIDTQDLRRALESEGQALALTLAAIANEHARSILLDVLKTGIDFLLTLLKR